MERYPKVAIERIDEEIILDIVIGIDIYGCGPGSARKGYRLRLAFLLGEKGRECQGTRLEFRLYAEESLAARDERGGREGNVSGLDALDDFIVITGIIDMELIFVFERPLCIPVGKDFKFIADGAVDINLDVLIEVRGSLGLFDLGEGNLI